MFSYLILFLFYFYFIFASTLIFLYFHINLFQFYVFFSHFYFILCYVILFLFLFLLYYFFSILFSFVDTPPSIQKKLSEAVEKFLENIDEIPYEPQGEIYGNEKPKFIDIGSLSHEVMEELKVIYRSNLIRLFHSCIIHYVVLHFLIL